MRGWYLFFLGWLLLPCGGCVFQDIRDEVLTTNQRISQVENSISTTKAAIDQTNLKLADLESGVSRLDVTNASLKQMEERMALLRSIEQSLGRLDSHLTSLRKTIGRISSMMPFLDLGTEDVATTTEPDSKSGPDSEPGSAKRPPPTSASAPTTDDAAAPHDAIIGAWVRQFPDRSGVLIVLEGGRYLWQGTQRGQSGDRLEDESGVWTKQGKQLHLTRDASSSKDSGASSTPVSGPSAPSGLKQPAPPSDRLFEIVARSAKSMTLQASDGQLMIYTKP